MFSWLCVHSRYRVREDISESAMLLQSNYFRGDANTAISESDAAFQQRVNNAPTPSSS